MVVDEAAPGEGLVADAHAVLAGQLAESAQIVRRPVDPAQRQRRNGRADEDEVGAELVHRAELASCALEGARALGLGQALEVAEGLEQRNLQARVAHHAADIRGAAIEGEEIVLEDFDGTEPGRGDGRELFRQVAGQRHRRDGRLHRVVSSARLGAEPQRDGAEAPCSTARPFTTRPALLPEGSPRDRKAPHERQIPISPSSEHRVNPTCVGRNGI